MPLDQFLSGQSPQQVADQAATWGAPGALAQVQQGQVPFSRSQSPQQRMQLLQMLVQTGRARNMGEADALAKMMGK